MIRENEKVGDPEVQDITYQVETLRLPSYRVTKNKVIEIPQNTLFRPGITKK